MNTRERIENDFTTAMKARAGATVSTLRMLRAALKNAEIDKMKPLEEADVVDVIGKEVKKLRDAFDSYVAGKRDDLAENARTEIATLEAYLPAQLDDDALRAIVRAKAEGGTAKDFGRIMNEVMKEAKGRADGSKVSRFVKEALEQK